MPERMVKYQQEYPMNRTIFSNQTAPIKRNGSYNIFSFLFRISHISEQNQVSETVYQSDTANFGRNILTGIFGATSSGGSEYSGRKEPKGILCIPFDFQPKFLESVESMEASVSSILGLPVYGSLDLGCLWAPSGFLGLLGLGASVSLGSLQSLSVYVRL